MTVFLPPLQVPSVISILAGVKIVIDPDACATVRSAKAAAGSVVQCQIDNTKNAVDVFLKLYDAATGDVTLGTTVPLVICRCKAGLTCKWVCPAGIAFATAVSYAVVTAGGTAGTSAPPNSVTVRIETIT